MTDLAIRLLLYGFPYVMVFPAMYALDLGLSSWAFVAIGLGIGLVANFLTAVTAKMP